MSAVRACYHCGEPVDEPDRWRTTIDGVAREMCCAGCQAVAAAIVAGGLQDYYRTRSAPAAGAAIVPAALPALRIWDDEQVQARVVRRDDGDCETTLLVDGLRCGACVWLVEQALRRRSGVVDVSVNLATERATLRWNPAQTRLSTLLDAIGSLGYRAQPFDLREREAQIRRTSKALFRRLFIAALAMMQVMMYAFPSYIAQPGDIDPGHESLMRWASLALTVPVIAYSASPFFVGAWRDLRARSVGMDVPVVIGLVAAFVASVRATISGEGDVYFDSVTMFVCLLLAARYVEWIARRRAGRAIDAVAAAAPDSAQRIDPATGATERVPATRVAPGDRFLVSVGERIAVDARIVEGRTAIDQSLLTGESLPVPRAVGDEVPGGAINAGNPIVAQAVRASGDSAIWTIERLVGRAAAQKPRLAGLAERVARVFVASLLLLAGAVWLAWLQIDPARAATIAIAVLVVSCPCALSMATPAALAAATGAALRRAVLIARGDALERVADCTDVVFDKTGTLTRGVPRIVRVERLDDGDASGDPLAIAAALESGQSHPLAEAIRRAAHEAPSGSDALSQSFPGYGVEGVVDGRRYRLGAPCFIAEWHPTRGGAATPGDPKTGAVAPADPEAGAAPSFDSHADADGETLVWLADERRPLAILHFRDRLRDEAQSVVDTLSRAGLRLHLLSGDRSASVHAVANELGIADVRSDAQPEDKLEYVRALQRHGRRVLMVGDGINDAPVLAAADVSVAVGNASSLARTSAAVVLLGESLHELPALRTLALRTRAIVRQNLGWALGYNAVAIPAAALGWVPPWLAALGMSASSLLVVLNALRLIPAARVVRPPAQRPIRTPDDAAPLPRAQSPVRGAANVDNAAWKGSA